MLNSRILYLCTLIISVVFANHVFAQDTKENKVVNFNGVDSYINLGNSNVLKPKEELTIGVWVYIEDWYDTNTNKSVFANSQNSGLSISVVGGQLQTWLVYAPDSDTDFRGYSAEYISNGWHHLAISKSKRSITFYVDGQIVSNRNFEHDIDVYYNQEGIDFLLGAEPTFDHEIEPEWDFRGMIDDFMFWNKCLTREELLLAMAGNWNVLPNNLLVGLDFNDLPLKLLGKANTNNINAEVVGDVQLIEANVPKSMHRINNIYIQGGITSCSVLILAISFIMGLVLKNKGKLNLEINLVISFICAALVCFFLFGTDALFSNSVNFVSIPALRGMLVLIMVCVLYYVRYFYFPGDTERDNFQPLKLAILTLGLIGAIGVVVVQSQANLWVLPLILFIFSLSLFYVVRYKQKRNRYPFYYLAIGSFILLINYASIHLFASPITVRIPQVVLLPWIFILLFIYTSLKRISDTPLFNNLQPEKPQEDRLNSLKRILSPREYEVYQLLGGGCKDKEIAGQLFISENTVKTHLKKIYQKLEVSNRTEAVAKSIVNH